MKSADRNQTASGITNRNFSIEFLSFRAGKCRERKRQTDRQRQRDRDRERQNKRNRDRNKSKDKNRNKFGEVI